MSRCSGWSGVAVVALAGSLAAQTAGTATGKGEIDNRGTPVAFVPRFASAYVQNFRTLRFTWVVLTEKQLPAAMLAGATDHTEALRQWCEKEKTPFAALQLDAKTAVNQYVTCPANGGVHIEMLQSFNGLESIVVKVTARDAIRIKGSLKTGKDTCRGPGDSLVYCKTTGDYTFDAPFVK